jgi:sigma-B regulation protein RsbU (phosphoserine phosphatase)
MMMLQSCVSSLVRSRPNALPSELVEILNRVIYDNVRRRLTATEHVTFCLLCVHPDGRVQYSGAHEEILVFRAATGKVERIMTLGIWLGGRADIAEFTTDGEFQLQPGDRVLLYTDGIIEAQNEEMEEFGVERVVKCMTENAQRTLPELRDELFSLATGWAQTQVDDVTLLALEYRP